MMSQRQNDFFNIMFLVSGMGTKHAVLRTAHDAKETRALAATLHPDPKWPYFTWILTVNRPRCLSRFGFLGTETMAVSTWANKETMHDSASETEARTKNVPACGTSWVSGKETLDKHTGHEVTERRRLRTPAFDLVLSDTSFTTGTPGAKTDKETGLHWST